MYILYVYQVFFLFDNDIFLLGFFFSVAVVKWFFFFFFDFATNDTLCLRGFCIVSWYSYGRIVEIIRLLFLYCPLVRSGGNFV